MPIRASAFLAMSVLIVIFMAHATRSIGGDISPKPQIAEATKADARCWTDDPQKHVSRLGWITDPHANVKVGYNKRAETCVVEIAFRVIRDGQIVMRSRSVGNTAGREYAHFIWKADTASEEPPAIFCEVFLSSGEELECHSESEYDEIVLNLLH